MFPIGPFIKKMFRCLRCFLSRVVGDLYIEVAFVISFHSIRRTFIIWSYPCALYED